MLRSLKYAESKAYTFNYLGNTGLLLSKTEGLNDKTTSFVYEKNGKVREMVEPHNVITNISYLINGSGIVSVISQPIDQSVETWVNSGTNISIYKSIKSLTS